MDSSSDSDRLTNPLLDIWEDEQEPNTADSTCFHYRHGLGFEWRGYDPGLTEGRLDKETLRNILDRVNTYAESSVRTDRQAKCLSKCGAVNLLVLMGVYIGCSKMFAGSWQGRLLQATLLLLMGCSVSTCFLRVITRMFPLYHQRTDKRINRYLKKVNRHVLSERETRLEYHIHDDGYWNWSRYIKLFHRNQREDL